MIDKKKLKRIVVKVGSSTLTYENGKLNLNKIEKMVRVLSDFKNRGREIVIVSSGAVSAGIGRLNVDHRPRSTEEKQALAAVGQIQIMKIYYKVLSMDMVPFVKNYPKINSKNIMQQL